MLQFVLYSSNLSFSAYRKIVTFAVLNNILLKNVIINNNIFLSMLINNINDFSKIYIQLKDFIVKSIYLIPNIVIVVSSNKFYNLLTFNTFVDILFQRKSDIINFVIEFIGKQQYFFNIVNHVLVKATNSVINFLITK